MWLYKLQNKRTLNNRHTITHTLKYYRHKNTHKTPARRLQVLELDSVEYEVCVIFEGPNIQILFYVLEYLW